MVLNRDYNADDDWEVVSDEEGAVNHPSNPSEVAATPSGVPQVTSPQPSSTVEASQDVAVASVARDEQEALSSAETLPVDAVAPNTLVDAELHRQDQEDVAAFVAADADKVINQVQDNDMNPPKTPSVVEEKDAEDSATFHSANMEQEPLLRPELTPTFASIPDVPSGTLPNDHQQQQQSTRKPNLPGWLSGSINKIGEVIKDADAKHHIQQKARNSVKNVGESLVKLGDTIHKEATSAKAVLKSESVRITKTVQEKADQVDWHNKTKAVEIKAKEAAAVVESKAKELGETVKTSAVQAGEKVKALNKDGKVTDLLAAAAVIGGVILVAKGKPGAGAAMMATGGAAYAAGEATRESRRYEEGLNEDLHMD